MRIQFSLVSLVFLAFSAAFAGGPRHPMPATPPHQHEYETKFIENKGQWPDQVAYGANVRNGRIFFESGKLTYLFGDLNDFHDRYFFNPAGRQVPVLFDFHAFSAEFVGANPHPTITASEKHPEYHNYFLGKDPSRWASDVGLFQNLHYAEIYPGIDLAYKGEESGMKYEFYVSPGADPSQIRIRYTDVESISIHEGNLYIQTTVNQMVEQAPFVYQVINGRRQEVPSRFQLVGEEVSFELLGDYDPTIELVIDPSLIFSTFTGSTGDNFGYTATYDDAGNLYAGGITFGMGYPTTAGAFQVNFQGGGTGGAWNFNGGIDMTITKFNPSGTAQVYSTYVGGTDNEQPHSLITNAAGELFIYGITWSNDYPVSANAYDNSINGAGDIVVTRLNAAGNGIVASTYVGGSSEDGLNIATAFSTNSLKYNYGDDARGEIMLDDLGNVYVASCSQSNDFPATAGAFQTTFGGGLQDGVSFKLNPNLSVMRWATYLGGTANDACYAIKVDSTYNAYVSGGTGSPNFPTTAGAFQTAYGGAIDGFISHIAANGNSLLASTYIGTSSYDQSYFLELTDDQEVYVYGQTEGNWPITPGKYFNANGRQFVAKYENDLTANIWSTVWGAGRSTVDISPTAFLVDICGYVYMSGWGGTVNFQGGTTNGLPLTPDAFQSTTDGSDVYLIVLEQEAAALEYGSYIGGDSSAEHVDGGTSRFNKNLEVYHAVCAGCGGNSDFPTFSDRGTPWDSVNRSSNCNLAAFKFGFTPQNVIAAFASFNIDSCAPFPVNFTNNSTGAVDWWWDFGDGSPIDTNFNTSHVFTNPGTYPVKLVVVDSNSCNTADSVISLVTVYANPLVTVAGGSNICSGGSTTLSAFGGSTYNWSPATGLSATNVQYPIASPNDSTTYQVIVRDSNGCVDTGYVSVNVSKFTADAGPPVSFCAGTGGAQLMAGAVNSPFTPYYYEWWCDTTNTYCGLDSVFDNDPIANPTQTTTYYLQVTDGLGCKSEIDSTVVEVLPIPIVDAGPDQYICPDSAPGAQINASISAAPGPYTYRWQPARGLNDSTIINPYARPDTTTIYTLVVVSSNGCTSDRTTVDTLSSVTIHVKPQPIADAGPDRDICLHDSIMLQGYGFGAGPLYDFEWSPFTGLNDSARANPTASPPATTDYILTVWSNGCPGSDTVTVNVHTNPTANAGGPTDICLGESTVLNGFAGGDSTATYSFSWTPAGSLDDPTSPTPVATPDTTTTYVLISTTNYGCESPPVSVQIVVKPTPIAEAGQPITFCEGDSIQLNGSVYYTTTPPANPSQVYFAWTPPGGLISDSTEQNPWVRPAQTQFYYLTANHNTCSTTDSVLVTMIPDLQSFAAADTSIICGGDSVQLTAGGGLGGASFSWSPSTSLSDPGAASPMAAPDSTTQYLLVISEGGCSDSLIVPVEVIPSPEASYLSSSPEGCADLTVSFIDNSDDVIFRTWFFGDGEISNEQNPVHTYTQPGEYTVTLRGINTGGCADVESSMVISVSDPGQADFISDPASPAELALPNAAVQFTDQSRNATSWIWSFGDDRFSQEMNPNHQYRQEGEYFVTLSILTDDGCKSTVTKGPFKVFSPELFIPNVFSPNGDGVNDRFRLEYSGSQPVDLEIYDRWGGQLYISQNKLEGWDGTNKEGESVPEGVYFYRAEIGGKAYSGDVTLLR